MQLDRYTQPIPKYLRLEIYSYFTTHELIRLIAKLSMKERKALIASNLSHIGRELKFSISHENCYICFL